MARRDAMVCLRVQTLHEAQVGTMQFHNEQRKYDTEISDNTHDVNVNDARREICDDDDGITDVCRE